MLRFESLSIHILDFYSTYICINGCIYIHTSLTYVYTYLHTYIYKVIARLTTVFILIDKK